MTSPVLSCLIDVCVGCHCRKSACLWPYHLDHWSYLWPSVSELFSRSALMHQWPVLVVCYFGVWGQHAVLQMTGRIGSSVLLHCIQAVSQKPKGKWGLCVDQRSHAENFVQIRRYVVAIISTLIIRDFLHSLMCLSAFYTLQVDMTYAMLGTVDVTCHHERAAVPGVMPYMHCGRPLGRNKPFQYNR
jgi:hypothetical protein